MMAYIEDQDLEMFLMGRVDLKARVECWLVHGLMENWKDNTFSQEGQAKSINIFMKIATLFEEN